MAARRSSIGDSSEVAQAVVADGLDTFGDFGAGGDAAFDSADAFGEMASTAGAAVVRTPGCLYYTTVLTLLGILLVLSFAAFY